MYCGSPKISVIIPTYNCSGYIRTAIESVLAQSYRDVEIIVVDDGSVDDTKEVLAGYLESGFIRYIYQSNRGAGAARNKGIELSKGEYVAFLDADDKLFHDSLKSRKEFLDEYQNVMLVFGDYFWSIDNLRIGEPRLRNLGFLGFFRDAIESNMGNRYVFGERFVNLFWEFSPHPIWTCTVMLRRSLTEKVGYFRTDVNTSDDLDYWMRTAARCTVGYIDEPQAVYIDRVGSVTKNVERYCFDAIKLYSEHLDSGIIDRKIITKKMSDLHFELGYHYIWQNKHDKARRALVNSLKYNFKNYSSAKCFLLSFLPSRVLSALRNLH